MSAPISNKYERIAKESFAKFTIGCRVNYFKQGEFKTGLIVQSNLDDLNWIHTIVIIPDGEEFGEWITDPHNGTVTLV